MTAVPDITDSEQWVSKTTLRARYGRDLEYRHRACACAGRLHPSDRGLTSCPTIHWQSDDGDTFGIFKRGERKYRCQFFYKPYEQMGIGTDEYDDLAGCAGAPLQAQADHAAGQRGDLPRREAWARGASSPAISLQPSRPS